MLCWLPILGGGVCGHVLGVSLSGITWGALLTRVDRVADILAEHWFTRGGCCCKKQEQEWTYHVAHLIMKVVDPGVVEDYLGKAKGGE